MPQEPLESGAATPDEVLHVVTQLMHGSEKQSDQLKAADMLAKHHGLLTPKEESGFDPELITQIEAAVAAIAAQYDEPEPDAECSDPAADDTAGAGSPLVRP